jgi:hypothetical protein
MHNIASVTQEAGQNEFGEFESLNEFGESEAMNKAGEFEGGELLLREFGEQGVLASEGELNEMQEYELAAELLAVSNEQELEQFLGNVFRRAAGAIGRFAASPAGKALCGILKNVARQAWPVVGTALGNLVMPGAVTPSEASWPAWPAEPGWSWKDSVRRTANSNWPAASCT